MSFQSEELAKKPGVSVCRPISTLNLLTSKDEHAHAHTDAPARALAQAPPEGRCPRGRGRGCAPSALCALLLLTFLYAALLGHVFFALVKWKLSREAETLFTFRFDRL